MTDTNSLSSIIQRVEELSLPEHNWYQGFSDAGFWSHTSSSNDTATILCPDQINLYDHVGYITKPFDPGVLWDIIVYGDDGRICLFRIHPQDDKDLHQIAIDFSTTEGEHTPNWTTPTREDFIAEYNRQRTIIESRYAYIAGSNR